MSPDFPSSDRDRELAPRPDHCRLLLFPDYRSDNRHRSRRGTFPAGARLHDFEPAIIMLSVAAAYACADGAVFRPRNTSRILCFKGFWISGLHWCEIRFGTNVHQRKPAGGRYLTAVSGEELPRTDIGATSRASDDAFQTAECTILKSVHRHLAADR